MPGEYVYLDQGGELYNNKKVGALFQCFGYAIYPTGADSSHQNGPVERAHQTIGNALRTMLIGSNLDAHFWPYAFHAYLRIKNALPLKDDRHSSPTFSTPVPNLTFVPCVHLVVVFGFVPLVLVLVIFNSMLEKGSSLVFSRLLPRIFCGRTLRQSASKLRSMPVLTKA
jgi:hypothetical protein